MLWFRKTPLPPIIQNYIEATPKRIPGKTPLNELLFIALDCETTGFNSQQDRMLSLAIAELRGGRLHIARSAAWIFRQNRPVTQAVSVHGILPSDTAVGQPEPDILLELLPRLHNAIIVGHHIGFDVAMLNAAMKRHFKASLRNQILDTGRFAMQAVEAFARTGYPGQREPTLDEVCSQCDITPTDRHTADGDTFTTATLFLAMCARRQRQLGRPLRANDLPLAPA
ncbi:MAG: 3'-5' exonuclease [Nibricoccus sp.]